MKRKHLRRVKGAFGHVEPRGRDPYDMCNARIINFPRLNPNKFAGA